MDLCGVDYAAYGQGEWMTEQATGTGSVVVWTGRRRAAG